MTIMRWEVLKLTQARNLVDVCTELRLAFMLSGQQQAAGILRIHLVRNGYMSH